MLWRFYHSLDFFRKKVEKDEIVKDALANAKLWEVRYAAADKSRQEYRENVLKLVSENEQLRTNVIQVCALLITGKQII